VDLKLVIDRKLMLAIADGTMELDGKVIYVTKDMRVGLFS
jgi:3-hydroxyacyl-[acyl-carrier protein] dehydratase/trans-2-decenoyl-[acyl-carrier protein] isomerase